MSMITILCPTYGRPRRLEELIASFLRQDYDGAHLQIWNDHPDQVLRFIHPRITIHNLRPRCPSYGIKRQLMLEAADPGLVAFWDDDDIYLPNHLSYSLGHHALYKTECSKHLFHWVDGGHSRFRITTAGWCNTLLATRDLLLGAGGFDCVPNHTCEGLIRRLLAQGHLIGPGSWDHQPPTFIYRQDDGHHHVSREAAESAYDSMDRHADTSETGSIQLLPHWEHDYQAMADASWQAVRKVPAGAIGAGASP